MSKCPNFEPSTNKALKKMGIEPTPENRTRIFYTICIVLRLLLAGLILQFKDNKYVPYIILCVCIGVSYRIYNNLYGQWWWKRIYHLAIYSILAIVCLLIIFKKITNTEWMGYIMYVDVFIGVVQSIGVKRC